MRFTTGIALSPTPTPTTGPLLFAGCLKHGLERAAELGFAAVELSVRNAAEVERVSLTHRLDQLNLAVSAIATGQACVHDGACLTASSTARRDTAVERLLSAIELAAALDACTIVGGIRGSLTGSHREQSRQREGFHAALGRCARAAARAGVTLLLEPINRYETNFIHTAADGLETIATVGEENIKLLLDTFHMNIEEVTLDSALHTAGDRLGYLHLADSNRRAPGQGHLDFDALLTTAAQIGYSGAAVSEIMPAPDDETAAEQAAAFWGARAPITDRD